jgi:WhiB family redox-sensing transcriptional regulator
MTVPIELRARRINGLRPAPALTTTPDVPVFQCPAWMRRALCRQVDPEVFYPGNGDNGTEAKAVCADCPVRSECLMLALERREEFGIWGGLSTNQRRRLLRRMAAA